MTWTFDPEVISTNRTKLRLEIGDTDENDPQFSDEILDYYLSIESTVLKAAIRAVEHLIAKYSRQVDRRIGDLALASSQRIKSYRDLLASIKRRSALDAATVFAGGITISNKQSYEDNTDLVNPRFSRELHQHPGTEPQAPQTDNRYW